MVPAQQRFEPGDLLGRGLDNRLVIEFEPAVGHGIAQILFHLAALFGVAVQVWCIEVMASAPAILCGIQRKVGVADQGFAGHAIIGCQRDADRSADHHAAAIDGIGLRHAFDDPCGKVTKLFALDLAGQDHLKLVPAKAADAAHLADNPFQPLRHLFEQGVARRMAERVVDLLEPIQIEQKHRAGPVLNLRREQDLFERLRHAEAVRQAGQRIEVRKPRSMFLRTALFREIGA